MIMPLYNVHLYRAMRLYYPGIEAATHEVAARLAAEQPTKAAAKSEDCEGISTAALVDVMGDEEYEQSKVVEFDKPAPDLLAENERLRNQHAELMAERDAERLAHRTTKAMVEAYQEAKPEVIIEVRGGVAEV